MLKFFGIDSGRRVNNLESISNEDENFKTWKNAISICFFKQLSSLRIPTP